MGKLSKIQFNREWIIDYNKHDINAHYEVLNMYYNFDAAPEPKIAASGL